ncbi:MCE family protein [Gordonia rhizosphera]|uniref:Mce family protein n=1 Tax=Gordonia rhizosphera NBRC 16068 TaxID=1108045 RepID=K6W3R1_9ACTN|nr:MCE family protein [Gordonia rhizosphera]GAB88336.1 Mce family protein [Gordonia rhizosphera NBRC 16068]
MARSFRFSSLRLRHVVIASMSTLALTSCTVGLQDLPVNVGGRNSFDVTAALVTADGIVSGADVRSGQQIVGRVIDIGLVADHAELTLALDDTTQLPENVTASVELPSALGTPFIRLTAPDDPQGQLGEGDHIALAETSVGPQVEGTLAALGNILGGSGVSQLQSVMSSLNTAFADRSDKVVDLIDTLNRLLAKSSLYTDDFNRAMAAAADVSDMFVAQGQVVDDFLDQVPQAVNVLAAQREQVARLMNQTTSLSVNLAKVVDGRQPELNGFVSQAQTLVDSLGTFNDAVGQTLGHMNSFMTNFNRAIRGDYLVFDGALDIPGGIDKILTGGIFASGQPLPGPTELRDVLTGGLSDTLKNANKAVNDALQQVIAPKPGQQQGGPR